MVKKIFSYIVSIVFMFALITLSALIVLKSILSAEMINNIVEVTLTEVAKEETETYAHQILDETLENANVPTEVLDYVEDSEVTEYISDYVNDFINYQMGQGEAPKINNPKFDKLFDEAVTKFEDKTGREIDDKVLKEYMTKVDEKIEEQEPVLNVDTNVGKAFTFIYNDTALYISIAICAICVILIFVINKNIVSSFKYIGVCLIVNSIVVKVLSIALDIICSKLDPNIGILLSEITVPFNKVFITQLIIGLILVIAGIIIYKRRQNKNNIETITA